MFKYFLILPLAFFLGACATTSKTGEKVMVAANVGEGCRNLGPVTVFITGWGLPSESLAVLRNNTADKGGNTLIQTGSSAGIAYSCPTNSFRN